MISGFKQNCRNNVVSQTGFSEQLPHLPLVRKTDNPAPKLVLLVKEVLLFHAGHESKTNKATF